MQCRGNFRFKSGHFKDLSSCAGLPVDDNDCTEANLSSLLGVMSVLGPGDKKEAEQVMGQVVTITRRLVLSAEGEERRLTLSSITGPKEEGLVTRVHGLLMEHLSKSDNIRPEILRLLTSSNKLNALTLGHFLSGKNFSDTDFDIFQVLKDSKKDKIEVHQDTVLRLEDILCSRYHSITSEAQLDSVTRLLCGLLEENDVKRKYLENRALLVRGEDCLHSYEGCTIEDLCEALECEMSVEMGDDKRDLVDVTLTMYSRVLQDSDKLSHRVLDTVCDVWNYQNRGRGEENKNSRLKNTIIIIESLVKILDKKAKWRKIYKQCEDRYEEIRLRIWNMVSEPFLERDDLTSLLEACKHENKLCLSLEATKLVLKHAAAFFHPSASDITLVSAGYWVARGRLSTSMEKDTDKVFLDWKSGHWNNPLLARLGLVILGEQFLDGCDDFTHNANLSVLRKLDRILSSGESVEAALTSSPRDWWGPELMSEKLATVVTLVMLKLYTNTIPGLVTRPSPRFTVTVLLPHFSSILLSPAIPDLDISTVMTRLMDIIKSVPRNKVSTLLETVYQKLQPDLKAALNHYIP